MRGFSFAGCSDMPLTPTLSPQAGEGDHKMSPDLYFAFTLVVKMAVTAVFLLAATITAERASFDRRAGRDAPDKRGPCLYLSRLRPRRTFHRPERIGQSRHQCLQRDFCIDICTACSKALAGCELWRSDRSLDCADVDGCGRSLDSWFGRSIQCSGYRCCFMDFGTAASCADASGRDALV